MLQESIASCDGKVNPIRIFTIEELRKATNNYAYNHILHRTGFYTTYKGTYEDRMIMVKLAITCNHNGSDTRMLFMNEIIILSQIRHNNVVKLLGCCLETQIPILVFELLSNGCLTDYIIHKGELGSRFPWEDHLRIATEVAEALAYLHEGSPKPIVHRDFSSSNILLDEHYISKVLSFELSVTIPLGKTYVEADVAGTVGYLDPEYVETSRLTEKSDVYSFGVVLIELLTGWRPVHIVSQSAVGTKTVQKLTSFMKKKCLELEGETDQKTACAELALRCLQEKGSDRPTMKEVCQELWRIKKL